ncbi:MAG: DNA-3-methyladenine glycosylase I, partial [Eggerthellaceae bacterium]|nr:DNA-3-methyladenine glycosylase I [Eggerthellaceae bacterium]
FIFEMLCLECASVGLSWRTIMHKRDAYRLAFCGFDIDACANLSDEYLESQLRNAGLIRNRAKIFSVRSNARAVLQIKKEFGSFDAYLWGFTDGKQTIGNRKSLRDVPTQSPLSNAISLDMKRRGISFMGSVITYSFLQSIGMIDDHLIDCPCFEECKQSR